MYRCHTCSTLVPRESTSEGQRYRAKKSGKFFCNPQCGYADRTKNLKPRFEVREAACSWCGKLTTFGGSGLSYLKSTGRGYCSASCSSAYRSKRSSETASITNTKYASDRMKSKNPMARPETRAKVSASLKALSHSPPIRGGNGKPPTVPETILSAMFGDVGFVPQGVIRTGYPSGNGVYPPCYKPDLVNFPLRLAIEADGGSHSACARKAADAKKDSFLIGLGWTVLRFSNQTILTRPESVWEEVMSTISRLKGCIPTSQME